MTVLNRIQTLLQYAEENSEDAFTKYLLALEYVKAGNDMEARKWMENIYHHCSDYLPNYYHYGKLLERSGAHSDAVTIYRKGMVLARNSKDVHAYSELQGALEALDDL